MGRERAFRECHITRGNEHRPNINGEMIILFHTDRSKLLSSPGIVIFQLVLCKFDPHFNTEFKAHSTFQVPFFLKLFAVAEYLPLAAMIHNYADGMIS